VLDQEYRKESIRKHSEALANKKTAQASSSSADGTNPTEAIIAKIRANAVKRDFFGRIIQESMTPDEDAQSSKKSGSAQQQGSGSDKGRKVWVTYHDGFSNAVRKPISMAELLGGL
jgi:chromosome transmission fidelity protein 18